ncbi:hypothetical protein [Nocardia pneumoniae]|uniref:hypothetical protein n=1 Tax=Nocardia pneumoniae TaxID=228601 RepID=UPI000312FA2F|nr:hypothetical protein [Nocardia pneumoniae]
MTHARHSAVLAAAPLHTGPLFGAVTVTVLAAGVIVLAMIAGNRTPQPSFDTGHRYGTPNARDIPFLVGAAAGVVALLGGIACLVLIAPAATDDTAAEAPDPLAATRPGDCVAIPAPHASGGIPATVVPARCDTLPANFRVLQTGSCTDPRVDREHRRTDRDGREQVHLCLTPDWQAGVCYDVADWQLPRKVDCARVGKKIIRITAVLPHAADASACPRDADGANAVGRANWGITLCMRGFDRPDE